MDVNEIETEALKITIKMIEMCIKKSNNKSISELIDELISDNMKNNKTEILTYIPRKLAEFGYDIVETDPLILEEY